MSLEQLFRKIRVALIGCGRIAAGHLDPLRCDLHTYLSEMRSLNIFDLRFICDSNPITFKQFTSVWNEVEAFTSEDCFFSKIQADGFIDLLIISSPTNLHLAHLGKAREAGLRHVIVEKPITMLFEEWSDSFPTLRDSEILMWLNFTRSWNNFYSDLKFFSVKKKLGNFISGKIVYSQGVLNCLIHVIDLLHLIFDNIEISQIDEHIKYRGDDCLVNFFLTTNDYGGEIEVRYIEGLGEAFLEMELVFDFCTIRLKNNLTEIELDVAAELGPVKEILTRNFGWTTQFRNFLLYVAKSIINNADTSEARARALKTEQFCHDLVNPNHTRSRKEKKE